MFCHVLTVYNSITDSLYTASKYWWDEELSIKTYRSGVYRLWSDAGNPRIGDILAMEQLYSAIR